MAEPRIKSGEIEDGAIMDVDINASAAIAVSKLAASASTIVGTKSSGGVVALTPTEAKEILSLGNVDNTSNATERAATATLSGKTLSNPTINGSTQGIATYTPASGATATLDLAISNIHSITMPAGNAVLAVSNAVAGKLFVVEVIQDGSGNRTVTWFSTIKWAGGTAPTLTATGNKKDVFIFRTTGVNTFDGFIVGQNV